MIATSQTQRIATLTGVLIGIDRGLVDAAGIVETTLLIIVPVVRVESVLNATRHAVLKLHATRGLKVFVT